MGDKHRLIVRVSSRAQEQNRSQKSCEIISFDRCWDEIRKESGGSFEIETENRSDGERR